MQLVPITSNVMLDSYKWRVVLLYMYRVHLWQVSVSTGTQVSSTNKTYHTDITDILLKVALNNYNHYISNFKLLDQMLVGWLLLFQICFGIDSSSKTTFVK